MERESEDGQTRVKSGKRANGEWGVEGKEDLKGTLHKALNTQDFKKLLIFSVHLCASLCPFLLTPPQDRHFSFSPCPDLRPSQRSILRQGAGHGDAQEERLQYYRGQQG